MKYNEKIYDPSKKNFRVSSELYEFKYPNYSVGGMAEITSGLTVNSSNVYIIEDDVNIDVLINFIDDIESSVSNVLFNYYILQYDTTTKKFLSASDFTSNIFEYETQNHSSTFNTSGLVGEGEYVFKLGFQFDMTTEIADKLGKRTLTNTFNPSLPYGNYDKKNDKYFIVLYKAEEPRLDVGIDEDTNSTPSTLTINSLLVEDQVGKYAINNTFNGDLLISFNGMILTKGIDYTLTNGLLEFSEPLEKDDLVNLIYIGKSNNSGIRLKTLTVGDYVEQGVSGNQQDAEIYYNTDSSKYEIYTDYRIKREDSVIVMINGVSLSNGVDFLVSSSNKKRIILTGQVKVGDNITVLYDSGENQMRAITEGYVDISWFVNSPLLSSEGEFIIEFSKRSDFFGIEKSVTVPHIKGEVGFNQRIELNYPYGEVLYYRVKNIKRYTTISGDVLETENISDSIRIEIKTNISDKY